MRLHLHVCTALVFGALTAAGCHGGSNGNGEDLDVAGAQEAPVDSPTYDWYVDAASGSDSLPGTESAPFKTITRALAMASTGQTIKVAPGTYNTANGEIFPLSLPAGVSLIGDEANKGGGTNPTRILGGGNNVGGYGTAIDPGANSVVAGFTITDTNTTLSFPMELAVRNNAVTIRNNRIQDGKDVGIYVYNNSTNHLITGNVIQNIKNGWSGLGLGFINGGNGSKVENNVITGNEVGVEYDNVNGGDLGGGSAGSVGGNTLAQNSRADLWTVTSGITITAKYNFWDHAPPTKVTTSSGDTVTAGNDVYTMNGGATIDTSGAQLAP